MNLKFLTALLLFVISVPGTALPSALLAKDELRAVLGYFVKEKAEIEKLVVVLAAESRKLEEKMAAIGGTAGKDQLRLQLRRQVVANLRAKIKLSPPGSTFPLRADEIERSVIGYERFKLEKYVSSGVFPKRYFGYFDCKYDTAADEIRLRRTVKQAVTIVNQLQEQKKSPLRISDAEVAVTFIAEGGALLLGGLRARIDQIHPVRDVGLNDLAKGFADQPLLRARLDQGLGTQLGQVIAWRRPGDKYPEKASLVPEEERWLDSASGENGPGAYLLRTLTFEEAVAATALMWVWEKEIAAQKILQEGQTPIEQRPWAEQFVIGSLIYNSGILHVPQRWQMILDFSTGAYVHRISEKNAARRPRLPVLPPQRALSKLLRERAYPAQPTSWLAVYHVLQR